MKHHIVTAMAAVVLAAASSGVVSAAPPSGRGNEWVRSHPFTLMGLNIVTANLDVNEYRAAGLNVLLAWEDLAAQTAVAASAGLPWHAHVRPVDQGPDAYVQNLAASAAANAGGQAWLLQDEPSRLQMTGIGQTAAWLKSTYPNMLVYCNAFPSYASPQQLYGDGSNPGYSWSAYLDDFLAIIQPDLLMYDYYPFEEDGDTKDTFFADLMMVRAKALAAGIPYFAFLQSWASSIARLPSESDLRMEAFSYLAAGYSGLAYFTYDHFQEGGLLDAAGDPTALYHLAATLNAEISNLGQSLRFLVSTDVRFLAGEHNFFGTILDNDLPNGLLSWTRGSGGDPHIQFVDVDSSSGQYQGKEKNGLIGFFTDDDGHHYFMLVNLSHGAGQTAQQESLPFRVEFDSTVDTLLELDRTTGTVERIFLTSHVFEVTLLGGSGRLYKYDDGPFAPDLEPEPGEDAGPIGPDAGPADGSMDVGGTGSEPSPDGGSAIWDGSTHWDAAGSDKGASDSGCGCRSSMPGAGWGGLALLFALVAMRRRRR